MSAPRASMDSSYSALFTAGLLNSSTPRSSLDIPLPSLPNSPSPHTRPIALAERRGSPPPKPLLIPPIHAIPTIITTPAKPSPYAHTHAHAHAHARKTPRGSSAPAQGGRRRSIAASPHAMLKSPSRTEMRSRELQAAFIARSPAAVAARRAREHSAENLVGGKGNGDGREKDTFGFKGMWSAPVAAISRLRRRQVPLSAPSPPPSKPLPPPPKSAETLFPPSPTPITFKDALMNPTTAQRRPLAPITLPQLPLKSFFSMDEPDEDTDMYF